VPWATQSGGEVGRDVTRGHVTEADTMDAVGATWTTVWVVQTRADLRPRDINTSRTTTHVPADRAPDRPGRSARRPAGALQAPPSHQRTMSTVLLTRFSELTNSSQHLRQKLAQALHTCTHIRFRFRFRAKCKRCVVRTSVMLAPASHSHTERN